MAVRVLVVEDVPELRSVIRQAVRLRGGFEVVAEAGDGQSAIRAAGERQPDVVVLDLGLPDLPGRQVVTALRQAAPTAQIVVYSGAHSPERFDLAPRVEGFVPKEQEIGDLLEQLVALSYEDYRAACIDLGPAYSDVAVARSFLVNHFAMLGETSALDDARLVVNELVANALVHGGSHCHLRASLAGNKLRLEVTDGGAGVPELRDASPDEPHGRGLRLVSALCEAWGVDPAPDGKKVVWAVLPSTREHAPASSGNR